MNRFSVFVRPNRTAPWESLYESTSASGDYPVNFSDLLDQALDSAYVDIRGSSRNRLPINTLVKIEFEDASGTYERYYVVGGDEATETPNGSGLWTHKIFLIEPTKLLEGILCQSITFTNALLQIVVAPNTWVVP